MRKMASVLAVFGFCAFAQANVVIVTVPVGNPGNVGDTRYPDVDHGVLSFGAVAYDYRIGKFEVTAGQYTAFLNAVGGVDTNALYHVCMSHPDGTWPGCGISQSGGGTVGNPYTYSVSADFVNRPVGWTSFWDACRFANWLHNGQPTGLQDASTTEDGAYTLTPDGIAHNTITRNPGWTWAVTSDDEWYKAAYYKGGSTNAGYWDYPTRSNTVPGRDMADESGNNANYYVGSGPYPIDSPHYTTLAGEFQNSFSPCGTFDQAGNVYEWSEGVVKTEFASGRVLRGGSYHFTGGIYSHARYRGFTDPTAETFDWGFRVVEIPEPTTLSLLLFGSLTMLRRRQWV